MGPVWIKQTNKFQHDLRNNQLGEQLKIIIKIPRIILEKPGGRYLEEAGTQWKKNYHKWHKKILNGPNFADFFFFSQNEKLKHYFLVFVASSKSVKYLLTRLGDD
jgi:hypothetical protein